MYNLTIETAGACSGSRGPGGYGYKLIYGKKSFTGSGYEPATTCNRMALTGLVEGLKRLYYPCNITVKANSMYVGGCIAHALKAAKKERRGKGFRINRDLVDELTELMKKGHTINFMYDDSQGESKKLALGKIKEYTDPKFKEHLRDEIRKVADYSD